MTISSQIRSAGPFTGAGVLVSYPFAFKVFQASDVLVLKTNATGTQSTLALSSDYTVAINSDQNAAPGGVVTPVAALPIGSSLNLTSNIALTQLASLTNAGGFFPKTIEDALDRLTIIMQQQGYTGLGQTLRVPEVGGVPLVASAAARANNVLAFDSQGNPTVAAPANGSAASLAINLASAVVGLGSKLVAFVQRMTGAAARFVEDKLAETVSVDDFGAVGNNVTDDYGAIVAAQTALAARGGGELLFTFGKTYRVGTPIPHLSGITYRGTGKSTTDNNGTTMGARIVSSVCDIFVNVGAINAGLTFRDLWIESQAGGGHVFNWTGAGLVAKVEIDGCVLRQLNPGKSVINGVAGNGVFSLWAHHFEYQYATANTVPAIYIASPTVNSIAIENFWSICSSGATSGTYSIWIESTNAGGAAFNANVKQGVFEVPGGGAVNLLSSRNCTIEDCGVYDLLVTPNNPMFRIAKGAGPVSANCSARRIRSMVGTALKPDLQIDISVGGQSGFVIEHCTLNWLDQVSANGANATHVSNTIANYENCAFVELSASAGLDLRWVSQAVGAHTYSLWNGFPGTNNGYLNISQDGLYQGAFSPGGLFQWGGTVAAPAFYVGQAGILNTKNKIYPGNPAGVDQAAAGLFAGSGVPLNVNGNNGDFYLRGDTPGVVNQRLYVKSAGAWTGIL